MLLNTLQSTVRCFRHTTILRSQNIESVIKKQNYCSWVSRRPTRVVNEEIVLDSTDVKPVPRKYVNEDQEHRPLTQKVRHKPPKKPVKQVVSNETYHEDGTPNIIKLDSQNRMLAKLMLTLKSRKLREKSKQILLEGHRLITDAIKAGVEPEIILFSRPTEIEKLPLPKQGMKLYKVPYGTLQLWSNLTTAPGIFGIFKCPESFKKEMNEDSIPLTIICDNVREPGNLGAILRAGAGVGCEQIILTKGCVDPWEAKVLRSASGAHFRVSISKSVDWNDIPPLISPNANIFIADNNYTVKPADELESSIVPNDSDLTDDVECAESAENHETETEENSETESTGEMQMVTAKELASRIPVIPYYSADYTKNEVVLIVGGETEGLSLESVEFARESSGVRVNIPTTNEVDSLNTGMALGIVAFEVRRQFALRKAALINQ